MVDTFITKVLFITGDDIVKDIDELDIELDTYENVTNDEIEYEIEISTLTVAEYRELLKVLDKYKIKLPKDVTYIRLY